MSSDIMEYREDLLLFVKSVILRYCPNEEDRWSDSHINLLDININIGNNSQIMFLFGDKNFKESLSERVKTDHIIGFEDIGKIIDFILSDHEIISGMGYIDSLCEVNLTFDINWSRENLSGISCGTICLKLTFASMELGRKYFYLLIQKYYDYLKNTPSFKKIENAYIDGVKKIYFDNASREKMMELLKVMDDEELRKLLGNLDNEVFKELVISKWHNVDDEGDIKERIRGLPG